MIARGTHERARNVALGEWLRRYETVCRPHALPVLIEVVDDDAHIERLLPVLDEMLSGSALVVIVERVRLLK